MIYSNGKRMPEYYKPELYDNADIDALVAKVYHKCLNDDCDKCPYAGEIDDESCKVDIILELWRKWHNVMVL